MSDFRGRFDRLSTPSKLVLFLTLALLPLGLVLGWNARANIAEVTQAADLLADGKAEHAANEIESLIARNTLALKIAASGSLSSGSDACKLTSDSLELTPAMVQAFSMRSPQGDLICVNDNFAPTRSDKPVAPGAVRIWVSPESRSIFYRVGLTEGSATGKLSLQEIRDVVSAAEPDLIGLELDDGGNRLNVISVDSSSGVMKKTVAVPIANRQLRVNVVAPVDRPRLLDQFPILVPVLMFMLAAILSWYLVRRLLLLPASRLQQAVDDYQPGSGQFVIPDHLGGSQEVRGLGRAFEQAVDRLEKSEARMADALAGQQKLVREVHHRVKNNLQVIASMLSIHGRNASTKESEAAYAAIGRRVDALSVVHRNHFAEVEESRGIALRPMLVELASTLKASVPIEAADMAIQLDVQPLNTTQDTAIAASFFITEVVEFAMLSGEKESVDVDLSRLSELAARLTVSSQSLVADEKSERSKRRQEFDRVAAGLARQLRSPLEEKFGRLSVVIPVFPEDN